MKALLVLLVVLGGVWLWRSRLSGQRKAQPNLPPKPQNMVCCHLCGTHIPGDEAFAGRLGTYCSQEHLQQSES